jgi:hypothetical protein
MQLCMASICLCLAAKQKQQKTHTQQRYNLHQAQHKLQVLPVKRFDRSTTTPPASHNNATGVAEQPKHALISQAIKYVQPGLLS